jgi:hypothetical protein
MSIYNYDAKNCGSRGNGFFYIWLVTGSNLEQDTGYSEWSFLWFSSVNPGKFRDSISY